jgi:hypothetical protein
MKEKQVEHHIVQAIRQLGGEVDSFSQPRNTMQTPGIPDLRAVFPAARTAVWLEVKQGKNKPTPHQIAWLTRECLMGSPATVVYGVNDLVWALVQLGVIDDDSPRPNPHDETVKFIDLWRFGGVDAGLGAPDTGAWADELAEDVGL